MNVIKQALAYLDDHPHWTIKPDVLLAVGDANRDIIAMANGGGGYPDDEAPPFRPMVRQAFNEALRYYRLTIAADPDSDAAREARRKAWALLAGLDPLDFRFYCVND